mgnify:CR=1 FL=1
MGRTKSSSRPVSVYLLLVALIFQGVSGLTGGVGLVADPSGAALGIPVEWLGGSPFDDYLIPGVILFVVLGVFPLVAAFGLWQRRRWSRRAALLGGIALTIWIGVEILIIGYQPTPPLQLIYGLLGVIILGLVMLMRTGRYHRVSR